jgi:hypothetical protein
MWVNEGPFLDGAGQFQFLVFVIDATGAVVSEYLGDQGCRSDEDKDQFFAGIHGFQIPWFSN